MLLRIVKFAFLIFAFGLWDAGKTYGQKAKSRFGVYLSTSYLANSYAIIEGRVGDKYHYRPIPKADTDGFQVAVGTKLETDRGHFSTEFGYSQFFSRGEVTNLKPEEDLLVYGIVNNGGMVGFQHRILHVAVARSFKFWTNFFVEPWCALSFQLPEKHLAGRPDSFFQQWKYQDPPNITVFRLADNFNRWLFSARVRLGYHFGPLTVFVSHERYLTRMSDGTEYQGNFFPMNFRASNISIGLAYTVVQTK